MRRFRRRRRYHPYGEDYSYSNDILLAEFEFYNKKKKVVDNNIVDSIREKLLNHTPLVFWTNEEFLKCGVVFKFYKRNISTKDKSYYEMFVKIITFDNNNEEINISVEDVNSCQECIGNKWFLKYSLTIEQSDLLSGIEDNKLDFMVLDNWDDTVKTLITNGLLRKLDRERDWDEYSKEIKFLFDIDDIKEPKYETEGYRSSTTVFHMLKVIERRYNNKNYRVALVAMPEDYSVDYGYLIVDDESDDYIYYDEGRICFISGGSDMLFVDDSCIEMSGNKMLVDLRMFNNMRNTINQILAPNEKIITPMIYRFFKERAGRFSGSSYHSTYGLSDTEKRLSAQYQKLLLAGKEIKIDSIHMTLNKIEIEGEVFKLEFKKEFLDVIENFNEIKNLIKDNNVRYNYNTFYEKLLQLSSLNVISMNNTTTRQYKEFDNIDFKVNGMDIVVKKDNNRIKINDVFCRIDDVFYILSKLICYTDIDEYKRYVREVSYIGVEWKKMISNGILIELNNPFYNIFKRTGDSSFEKLLMRFSLKWDAYDRRQVYLIINGEEYPIRYKGKFKRYFHFPRRSLSMGQLKRELNECIDGLDDKMIIEIVDNAVEEAKLIQKRGLELVANTIKDVKAKEGEIVISGRKLLGYLFIGNKTGSEYFVHKSDLSVYKKVDGNWNRRCVVDNHTKNRIFEDRLANRLVNVYNEPQYIFTLHNV